MKPFVFLIIWITVGRMAECHPREPEGVATSFQGVKHAATKPEGSPDLLCGDLLQKYAAKPAGLILLGCTKGQAGSQTVVVATYRVSGAKAAAAEKFFHERYGMGNLKFVCCGWEMAAGKKGQVASPVLKKLNPNYVLLIAMYADDQAVMSGDLSALKDKSKVKYFTVEVEIVNV